MALGMTAPRLNFGVVFAMMLKDFTFLAWACRLRLVIGIGAGTKLDEQAKVEGRQLDQE
ncbi:hypothetical protein C8E01_11863 [Pontibacter virosus]|uniref:Uncharacterized protein n=2 Tax=Pontibacter virosus TaxID=1765052 RepID=A0A2U1APA3_9BACT|nr:hypothetical protein C8E01_11863 [Pontibacter virosus]